jgi:Ca2+-binding EF-hand superfamily protein
LVALLALGLAAPGFAQAPPTAADRFAILDTNHDGTVSRDEYTADALFSALDADHNFRISPQELEAVIGPQQEGMPSAAERIRTLDHNGDGALNDEEMRNAAEARFQSLDRNQDDKVDLSELKAGLGVTLARP